MTDLDAARMSQLHKFSNVPRIRLAGDDPQLVRELVARGQLRVLRRRVPLYGLTEAGISTLRAAGLEPDLVTPAPWR